MQENPVGNPPEKKHFVIRLIPPRPTFMMDMTAEERDIMLKHVAYWKEKAEQGIAIVYGPVFHPKNPYGLGIIEVDSEDQAHALAGNDPAVQSGLQALELCQMRAVIRK